jgi:DNA-binding SARP family transcriptional activator
MPYLSISLLGPFQAWTADGALRPFRTLKERALLAYLVVEHDHPHRRETLASMFWPDRQEGVARNSLRQALFGIRQVIGDAGFNAIFTVTGDEVQVNFGEQLWLDCAAYELHLKAAQGNQRPDGGPCPHCLQHLCDAVEIYHGSFLEDIVFDKDSMVQQWVQSHREHYTRLQIQALASLADEYERQGDYHQAAFYA